MTLRSNHGTLQRLIDDKYNRDIEVLCSHLAISLNKKLKDCLFKFYLRFESKNCQMEFLDATFKTQKTLNNCH